jgi:ABC-type tungstate transport system permease subunit
MPAPLSRRRLLGSLFAAAALAPFAGCAQPAASPTVAPATAPTQAPEPTKPAATPTPAPAPTATVGVTPTVQPTAAPETKPLVMLSSTIGPIDAGIVDALESAFTKKTGYPIRHVGAGTGATLDQAKGRKFDVVIVHARALEDKFVADGFGVDRRDVMYNDFVILGPASDPAKIKGEKVAIEAFKKLAQAKPLFVTRGDNSGTDVKEKEIWAKAGIKPSGDWYVTWEKGSTGNAPTTKYADEKGAYLLMDRATVITLRKEIKLQVLVEKDTICSTSSRSSSSIRRSSPRSTPLAPAPSPISSSQTRRRRSSRASASTSTASRSFSPTRRNGRRVTRTADAARSDGREA